MSDTPSATFDRREGESVSAAVVLAIAEYEGRDPSEITALYRVIDPDSLNAIFEQGARRDGSAGPVVGFGFEGYWVRVAGPGDVELYDGAWPRGGGDAEDG